MKKLCVIFVIFSLFIFAGCGGSKSKNKEEAPGPEETVTDDDGNATDTEPSDEPDTEPTEEPDQDSGDSTTEPNDDDADTVEPDEDNDIPQDERCEGYKGPVYFDEELGFCRCSWGYVWSDGRESKECVPGDYINEELCENSSGTWDEENHKCTREFTCGAPATFFKWNGETTYTAQIIEDGSWYPDPVAEYNEEPGLCHFVCDDEYVWDGSECINLCPPAPCVDVEHSTNICTTIDPTTYICGCVEGYIWDGESKTCKEQDPQELCATFEGAYWNPDEGLCYRDVECPDKPEHSIWYGESTYTQAYIAADWTPELPAQYNSEGPGDCYFICEAGYSWNDTECVEAATDPCGSNPCAGIENSTCTASGETFECVCNEGFGKVNGECKPYCAAVFNGTNSLAKITAANNAALHQSVWTIEAWIKEGTLATDMSPLVAMQNSDNLEYMMTGFSKSGTSDVIVAGMVKTESENVTTTAQFPKPSTGWHHIALVNNGSKLEIFFDGELKNSKSYIGTAATVANAVFNVGYTTTGTGLEQKKYYFKGSIDQIRFSNTARYLNAFTPATLTSDSHTVALWDFNGNTNNSKSDTLHLTAANITYTTECR